MHDYTHHNAVLAGGGHVTIGKYPKPVIKATPKVNTVDNIKYLPSGGNVKVKLPGLLNLYRFTNLVYTN